MFTSLVLHDPDLKKLAPSKLEIGTDTTDTVVSCSGIMVRLHGLCVGGLGLIPTVITTRIAAGGDADHVSLNH